MQTAQAQQLVDEAEAYLRRVREIMGMLNNDGWEIKMALIPREGPSTIMQVTASIALIEATRLVSFTVRPSPEPEGM
jgi:hypothetical protein